MLYILYVYPTENQIKYVCCIYIYSSGTHTQTHTIYSSGTHTITNEESVK